MTVGLSSDDLSNAILLVDDISLREIADIQNIRFDHVPLLNLLMAMRKEALADLAKNLRNTSRISKGFEPIVLGVLSMESG